MQESAPRDESRGGNEDAWTSWIAVRFAAEHVLETEPLALEEIEALIDAYEIDIPCSCCDTTLQRSISWLHKRYMMNCPSCQSVIALRTSTMTEEIRRVSRQLKDLQLQLLASVGKANSILGR